MLVVVIYDARILQTGQSKKHGHGHDMTRYGYADTAFLKKVGHGHVRDTLIFNNNNISNHILKDGIILTL